MSNIFKQRQQYVEKPRRNNFGLSFTNNFSARLGRITPILCKETVPGDSFNIDVALGLRALPLVFPVQTAVTAEIEFYYVPCRILWDNFKDFVGRTKDGLVHPYLHITPDRASEVATGSLLDYLGIPTTYAGAYGSIFSLRLFGSTSTHLTDNQSATQTTGSITEQEGVQQVDLSTVSNSIPVIGYDFLHPYTVYLAYSTFIHQSHFSNASIQANQAHSGFLSAPLRYIPTTLVFNNLRNINDGTYNLFITNYGVMYDERGNLVEENSPRLSTPFSVQLTVSDGIGEIVFNDSEMQTFANLLSQNGQIRLFISSPVTDSTLIPYLGPGTLADPNSLPSLGSPIAVRTNQNIVDDVDPTLNPFIVQSGEQYPAIRLNALPCRAYEMIYNSFKRNNFINPLRINGEVEYNKYVRTKADGADSLTYDFFNRNYELDYLTDCRLSPQQGIAPLVGVTGNGKFKFEDENGNQFELQPITGDDGDTITGIQSYDEGLPEGSVNILNEMIKYGISISTFRATNALQVWLETNIRRGFRYEEQMFSHFGVNVSNIELQEPIFVGGFTRRVEVTEITATAKSDGIELGDYAGKASLFTQSQHPIRFTAQEHGFIIATLTIVPIPSYSQLLPKLFLKSTPLDYYFKEFAHLGMQPISYNEVCPLQAFAEGDDLNETFGYQRPNYDLIANVDEAHGLMRTEYQNYLLTRVFATKPLLSQSFIEVKPEDITSPFVDTSADHDTFLGQVYFDISAKRPVPRIAVASLEPKM